MDWLKPWIASGIFLGVIGIVLLDWIHLTIVSLLGAIVLVFLRVIRVEDAVQSVSQNYSTFVLLFGVMVIVRAFEPTGIFSYLAALIARSAKDGKRLLLGIVAITTPICAVLPNATTVMLLAPLIPPIASALETDFVPLLILMVFVANTSGLLTLVGDPATYLVGSSINLGFADYLRHVTPGGVLALGAIVVMIPWLFRDIWNLKFKMAEDAAIAQLPPIRYPNVLRSGAIITTFILFFFSIGQYLPNPITPPAVALMGAALSLLVIHQNKVDTLENIFRDIDWSTIIFLMSTFILVGALEKTGVIHYLAGILSENLGTNVFLGSLIILFLVGCVSSIVNNIPLVVAMVPLLKQYLVNVDLMDAGSLAHGFTGSFNTAVLPLFYAMMFGATLGGNATLVGASCNIIAAGIAEQNQRRIPFAQFLRYGVPITAVQLTVAACYIMVLWLLQ
jgi:Na+/H+ antiporter NhaD/arsenite permease-like protein